MQKIPQKIPNGRGAFLQVVAKKNGEICPDTHALEKGVGKQALRSAFPLFQRIRKQFGAVGVQSVTAFCRSAQPVGERQGERKLAVLPVGAKIPLAEKLLCLQGIDGKLGRAFYQQAFGQKGKLAIAKGRGQGRVE